jgi:peptide/nickel transport system substrate-binding protein
MKTHRTYWKLGLSLIMVLAVLVSACAPTETPPEPAAPTEEAAAPTEEAAAPTEEAAAPTEAPAATENVITYAYPRTISTLDPSLVLSSENNILWNVWGNLTLWDPDEGVIPFIADSWESNEDATEWTFHLHEGIKCHDGSDFTAEDVKFSWERTIEAGALAYVFAMVDTIEVVDDLTVKVNLSYPYRMEANAANSWGPYLMCKNVADKPPEWFAAGNENGVGPYRIESFEPGQRMVLAKFEDWFDEWPAGSFDKVVIEVIEDGAVRAQKLRAGEADIAWGISYDDFESLTATGDVTAFAIPAFQQLQWHFNMRRAPLDDLRVRQALAHSFPYEDARFGTFGGFGAVAEGAVPRVQWEPPVTTRVYEYDLDKAKALLVEAGVPEGTELRLGVEVNAIEEVKTAELWQAELAKLGINLNVEKISAGVRWDEVYNPDTEFDIMLMHMIIGFDSPHEYLGSLWHSGWTWYPFAGFASEEFDALTEEAPSLEAVDKARADALYQQAEQILFDEAVGVFALDLPQDWAVANDVHGFKPNPLYGYDVFFWQMGRGEPGAVAPPSAEEPTEAEPAAAEIPENVATYVLPASMPAMDPDYMLTQDHVLGLQLYETLTQWTPDQGIVPKLATSWESNEDGTEWTYQLREGVTFHDGTPFTAEAVKFSYERTLEAGLMSYYFDVLEEIEVIDDYTVRLKYSEPRPSPTMVSAGYGMFIVNPNIADKPEGWFEEGNDAGTGPYTMESMESGVRWVMRAYEDYWGGWEDGQFTQLVFLVIEDPTVRDQMIRSGEADFVWDQPYDSHESLAATGEIVVETPVQYANVFAEFHYDRAPMDDLRVRQALAHSFPYETVQMAVYGGKATLAQGVAPAALWKPPSDLVTYGYDLDKAKALLEEAGVGDGLELTIASGAGDINQQLITQLWQAELAKIGVDLKIEEISNAAWWDAAYTPDNEFDIMMINWAPGWASPNEFTILYDSEYTFTPYTGYANPEYDDLSRRALSAESTDMEEASQLYAQSQQLLYDDAVAVFMLDTPIDFIYRTDIEGFVPYPVYYDTVFWYDLRRK